MGFNSLKVLVACEESQRVTEAFRKLGVEAYSCDIQDPSGGHPEWHIKGDAIPLLNGNCSFATMDGKEHSVAGKWDIIIAHPPCTDIAVSGAKHFEKKREDGRQRQGLLLFCAFFEADCDHVLIENPVNIVSGEYVTKWFPDIAEKYGLPRKPSQIIQPYMFGDPFEKRTCLWLKGLPNLIPTKIVPPPPRQIVKSGKTLPTWYSNCGGDRRKARSVTFPGIAAAIATQYTEFLKERNV